jgi:hypothetical protein
MKNSTWGWIAAAAALLVAGGAVAYEEFKKPAASGGGGSSPSSANTLQPGMPYRLVLACPTAVIPVPPPPVPTTWAASLFSGLPITVQSVTPGGLSGQMASSLTIVFTYNGASPVTLPPIQASGATACSTTLSPLVSTPNPGPVHTGGTGIVHSLVPQNAVLQSAGQTVAASAVAGGPLNITAPGNIVSVQNKWGTASSAQSLSGNKASVTLTGTQGQLLVTWVAVTPNGSMQQQGVVMVS